MHPEIQAALLGAGFSFLGTLLAMAVMWGKVTARLTNVEKRVQEHAPLIPKVAALEARVDDLRHAR